LNFEPLNLGIFEQSFGVTLESQEDKRKAIEHSVIDSYRPICLCNKIRKGIIVKAIQAGAATFQQVRTKTGAGTGPCGAARCGPMIRGMLGEEVESCEVCGWSILKGPTPLVCPRCHVTQSGGKADRR
jgi:bacterioferritin-associated ferredoxin